jgi:hypothetical protein
MTDYSRRLSQTTEDQSSTSKKSKPVGNPHSFHISKRTGSTQRSVPWWIGLGAGLHPLTLADVVMHKSPTTQGCDRCQSLTCCQISVRSLWSPVFSQPRQLIFKLFAARARERPTPRKLASPDNWLIKVPKFPCTDSCKLCCKTLPFLEHPRERCCFFLCLFYLEFFFPFHYYRRIRGATRRQLDLNDTVSPPKRRSCEPLDPWKMQPVISFSLPLTIIALFTSALNYR